MRLTRLEAQNLLSFDTFKLDLDPQRTVIVGPNGSGKTNLSRLVEVAGSAVAWTATEALNSSAVPVGPGGQMLDAFTRARHLPDRGGPQAVRLGIELTTDREKDLFVAFLRAAALWSLLDVVGQGPPHAQVLADWVMAGITIETCSALLKGRIVAEHPGIRGAGWSVGYQFTYGATQESYCWVLQSPTLSSTILTAADAVSPSPGLIGATDVLPQRLLGVGKGGPALPTLPDLPPFSLDMVLPKSGEAVRLVAGERSTYLEERFQPFSQFLRLAGLPGPEAPGPGYSLAIALHRVYQEAVAFVGEQLRGVGTWGAGQPPAGRYLLSGLPSRSVTQQPSDLPWRLFRLKNGTAEERQRYMEVQRAFTRLAPGRAFDLRFELLSEASSIQQVGTVTEGQVDVLVSAGDDRQAESQHGQTPELPIQLQGAGAWEALVLAEALSDAAGRVVVLDEPATSLHPTWQRGLASQLDQSEGQLLLITHSPDLVRIRTKADLTQVVRISRSAEASVAHRLASRPRRDVVNELVRGLTMSAELRSCLFAEGVVLLEGETELGVLPRWFAQCASTVSARSPEALDVAFYAVGSDTAFAAPLTLIAGLRIPWVLICDGAAFDVGRRDHIFRQVANAGADSAITAILPPDESGPMDQATFDRLVTAARDHGILTLASGWTTKDKAAGTAGDESFEVYLDRVLAGARDEAGHAVGKKSKVRQGLWIAENYPPPENISSLYRDCVQSLRNRGLAG